MQKKDIIKSVGVTYNAFQYYKQSGIIDDWCNTKDDNEVKMYIAKCKQDIFEHKLKPIKKPRKLKECFDLPLIYKQAECLRGY